MIIAGDLGRVLREHGFNFFTGVPCSFLKSLINYANNELNYVAATNEGEAVAIAAGASLGGKRAGVLLQNSGLTNALGPLTSLHHPFQIPLLGFVSLRGEPGVNDEPQHALLGKITEELLRLCEVQTFVLGNTIEEVKEQFLAAEKHWKHNRCVFFIVKKGAIQEEPITKRFQWEQYPRELKISSHRPLYPSREDALKILNSQKDHSTVLLATTGKTGRELCEIEDSTQHFYMVGSMGCVSSIGLGLALSRQDKKVIAIDGDGALLMRMGSLASNAYYRPRNLLHILLDNKRHDSTGGQDTVSGNVCFAEVARHAGYPKSIQLHTLEELADATASWRQSGGLTFLQLPISPGSKKNLGRPGRSPKEVKEQLIDFLSR